MRGIEVPQAPPRSARPPPRAGAIATYQAIEYEQGFGWHKVRPTEVAAPTRRSGAARLISLIPKVRKRPKPPPRLTHSANTPCRTRPSRPDQASNQAAGAARPPQ